ncbi:MAG TPA: signal peptidase I, partial [Trebonia sp.]
MSTTSTENDDSPARRVTAVRSPQELDYRLRGLILDPAGDVVTAPAQPERPRRRPRRLGPLAARVAAYLIAAALAGWLLQAFVAQPFLVPGQAMTPSLQAGDRILVIKAGLLQSPVRSGQVVVIKPPRFLPCTVSGTGTASDLVLRVIALPGQTIWSIGDTIFVDGRPLREKGWYSPRSGPVGSTPVASTTLGP